MKKTLILLLLVAVTINLTGCGTGSAEAPEKAAVCYVIGNTANSKGLNLNSPLVQDTAYDVILGYGYVAVISVDEDPEVVLANSYEIDVKYKSASAERLKTDARAKATNLSVIMANVMADDPEVDYLEGLRLAVRTLAPLEGYTSKTIIVIGTGLSTSGVLDFRNNLLSAEPDSIVTMLAEREELPSFDGITVVWQQLGDVSAPQHSLTQQQRNRLEQIYGGIVEKGGGEFIYNEIMAAPINSTLDYPTVSVVDLPAEIPIKFEPESTEPIFDEPVSLSEELVQFLPDSADFLSPEKDSEILAPIAAYMVKTDPNITLLLAGCIAGDVDSENGYRLSLNRADTVKRALIDLGVPESRLITVGLGCSDPWHIPGVGYDGPLASENRKVMLLDASSELAQGILES